MTAEEMHSLATQYIMMAEEEHRRAVSENKFSNDTKDFEDAVEAVCKTCQQVRASDCNTCWIAEVYHDISDVKKHAEKEKEYRFIANMLHEKASAETAALGL